MNQFGLWARENPGLFFALVVIAIIVIGGGVTECGTEFAKGWHR